MYRVNYFVNVKFRVMSTLVLLGYRHHRPPSKFRHFLDPEFCTQALSLPSPPKLPPFFFFSADLPP